MTSQLKVHLEKHPEISHVHFNDEGQHLFRAHKSFPIKMTREEVLDAGTDEEDVKGEPDAETNMPDGEELDKTIAELIAVEGERDSLLKDNAALKAENIGLKADNDKLARQLAELKKKHSEAKVKAPAAEGKKEEEKTDNQQ